MRYRLNGFIPRPGSSEFDTSSPAEMVVALRRLRERFLRERLRHLRVSTTPQGPVDDRPDDVGLSQNARERELPDLVTVLEDGDDRSWVLDVHERLSQLSHSNEVRLLACEYEPGPEGFLCIAATSPSIVEQVEPGDWVHAGMAAMRRGDAQVRISPRIFRPTCDNGAIVSVREGADLILENLQVGAAVDRCFDRVEFLREVEILREAARTAVPDPRPMLNAIGNAPRHLPEGMTIDRHMRSIVHSLQGSRTLWDAINVVTAAARDLPDWRDRLDLEEAAGRLATLRRPVPRRTPGSALTLVGS